MKKHILIVSQIFYPEQFRINDIAKEWVKKGYKVSVLTGIPNYPEGKFFDGYNWFKGRKEVYQGIEIHRIPIIPRGNNSLMMILNYISFFVSGYVWHLFTKIRPDLVWIYEASPVTQALPGVWLANKRKIPCMMYVTDLWPENVEIITGIKSPLVIKPLEKVVEYIYGNCDLLFTSSRSFINSIHFKRGVPREKLLYWPQYAEDFYSNIHEEDIKNWIIPQDDKFNIIFAGNIGYAQGLEIVIDVAELVKKNKDNVRFSIVGDGRYKDTLLKKISSYELDEYVNFFDKRPAEDIPEILAQADASLITLSKNDVFSMTIPAKIQSSLACGIPILLSADGEAQDIIIESKAGMTNNAEDYQSLYKNILLMKELSRDKMGEMSSNGIDYFQENFKKSKLLEEMDNYLLIGSEKNV